MPTNFLPKGVSNSRTNVSWWNWLPDGGIKWLSHHTAPATPKKQNLGITRKKKMVVTSADIIAERLRELLISMASVKDVDDVVAPLLAAADVLKKSGYIRLGHNKARLRAFCTVAMLEDLIRAEWRSCSRRRGR